VNSGEIEGRKKMGKKKPKCARQCVGAIRLGACRTSFNSSTKGLGKPDSPRKMEISKRGRRYVLKRTSGTYKKFAGIGCVRRVVNSTTDPNDE